MAKQVTATQHLMARWASEAASPEEVTLQLCNIPSNTKKSELMQWIDESGFMDTYDFFYLPRNFETGSNNGYSFINFIRSDAARRFQQEMEGREIVPGCSLTVRFSVTRGLTDNLVKWARSRARRVKDPEVLPYVRGLSELGEANPAEVLTRGLHAPGVTVVPVPVKWNAMRGSSKRSGESEARTSASTPEFARTAIETHGGTFAASCVSNVADSIPPGRPLISPNVQPVYSLAANPGSATAGVFESTQPRQGSFLAPAARSAFPSAIVLWRFSA